MVTEEMIKKEFIHRKVSRDIRRIYATQQEEISKVLHGEKEDAIVSFLSSQSGRIVTSGGMQPVFYMSTLVGIRFLDSYYSRNGKGSFKKLKIYNRAVWGILYKETLPTLKYGLSENIKQSIREDLNESSPKNLD